jgi:peptide-methionine (S)-S-oxide reductase
MDAGRTEKATLGGGCFWCLEAIFSRLRGVRQVTSGYAGGEVPNPGYREVCSGTTGHAEVVQVDFDPEQVSFAELLEVFWQSHDPTTRNRQGADVGSQYRSVIFYHDDQQRIIAEQSRRQLEEAALWPDPIVTEIAPLNRFYRAENHHQDYFLLNPEQPYCRVVIHPKLRKVTAAFGDKMKT